MNLNEEIFDIPTEHMANVFGGCDKNIKKIERALHVTIAVREGRNEDPWRSSKRQKCITGIYGVSEPE